jgi:hypothetical protein
VVVIQANIMASWGSSGSMCAWITDNIFTVNGIHLDTLDVAGARADAPSNIAFNSLLLTVYG